MAATINHNRTSQLVAAGQQGSWKIEIWNITWGASDTTAILPTKLNTVFAVFPGLGSAAPVVGDNTAMSATTVFTVDGYNLTTSTTGSITITRNATTSGANIQTFLAYGY